MNLFNTDFTLVHTLVPDHISDLFSLLFVVTQILETAVLYYLNALSNRASSLGSF